MITDIYSVYAYGHPILRQKAAPIKTGTDLSDTIDKLFRTMEYAQGVGLAAPQVGISKRLFIIDTTALTGKKSIDEPPVRQIFINPTIIEETGEKWKYNEGCLSIPDLHEDVWRNETILLQYMDEHYKEHTQTFSGITARVIQHEYDHIEGVLFIDHLTSVKKSLIKNRLNKIMKGKIDCDYPMCYP